MADAYELMVDTLVRVGASREVAERETLYMFERMDEAGFRDVYVSVLLRRDKVRKLMASGVGAEQVASRLGISKAQVYIDYKKDMKHKRTA